jgi:4-hydroxy 2-oxovalerate aldolase
VRIKFNDVTLRDGNHALRHSLSPTFVAEYCQIADRAGLYSVEVGHGNGLGASSFLVGKSSHSDRELLQVARENLQSTKLGIHMIPGFATVMRDVRPAIEIGVDVFRVGTHVTEATTARKHIEFLANQNVVVHGVLMMSHTVDVKELVTQAKLLCDYGASAIVIMDSAGNYMPEDVSLRMTALLDALPSEVGFHAHNNLCVGVSNALAAIDVGSAIIDGSAMGLGAGAGNASLEAIVATHQRREVDDVSVSVLLELSALVEATFPEFLPRTTASSIQSGLAGVFSGFAPQVKSLANEYGISQEDLWQELGRRRLVAGQESMIREIALDLMNL